MGWRIGLETTYIGIKILSVVPNTAICDNSTNTKGTTITDRQTDRWGRTDGQTDGRTDGEINPGWTE